MTMVAISIEPRLYTAIEELVESGNYSGIQQFFVVAARNQLALEETGEFPHDGAPAMAPATEAPSGEARMTDTKIARSTSRSAPSQGDVRAMVRAVPVAGGTARQEPSRIDDDAILWGQVNRVLPIAAGVRVLAHLTVNTDGVSVAEWHEAATRVAMQLRIELRELDEVAGRRHGSLWSTALPDDTPQSAQRYVNQFLGHPRAGLSEGGAAFLGFVAFDDGGTAAPTTAGAEWAAFANPIFDGDSPITTFSADEVAFFIDHLGRYRPAELRFLRQVAALVHEGRSRTQIDEGLASAYPELKKYIETMRAGALGRLSDLGLLGRTRRGLTVDYALTPLAQEVGVLNVEADAA